MPIAKKWWGKVWPAVLAIAALLVPGVSQAVPLYARQTGMACEVCHFGGSFPELTETGREFKLTGYTWGKVNGLPLAGMVLAGKTSLDNTHGSADPASDFAHDKSSQLQQVSLFTGGRITDELGAFVQWTYNGVTQHSNMDNTDIRFASATQLGGKPLIYGATLNNSPTVQDLYNTTPAWRFPYAQPGGAFQGYGSSTLIEGTLAQQVAGLGAYADWNSHVYAELSAYRTADKIFSILRAGQDTAANTYPLSGTNPYWRLAYHSASGPSSWMVGTFGMNAATYTNAQDSTSPVNHYYDTGVDGQYQLVEGANDWSVQASWVHEKVNWDASTGNNASDTLDSLRIKGSYYYNHKLGGSIGLFDVSGSQDATLYSDNTSQTPNTQGYVLDFDYLPMDRLKLGVQYTGYSKFNGASSNYDASGTLPGRNARDNNTLYVYGWLMF